MLKILLFLIIFTFQFSNASHLDGKTVSYNDIFEAMISDEKDEYSKVSVGSATAFYSLNGFILFNNCTIVYNKDTDRIWEERFVLNINKIKIFKGIGFRGCTFPKESFLWSNFIFEGPIYIRVCQNLNFSLKNCIFNHEFSIGNTSMDFLKFENCDFTLGWKIADNVVINNNLTILKSRFSYNSDFYFNPKFVKSQNILGNLTVLPRFFNIGNRNNPFIFNIIDSEFIVPKELDNKHNILFDLSNSVFSGINIQNCKFNIPLIFSFVVVENQFHFTNNQVFSHFLAEGINFNSSTLKLEWNQLNGRKLAIKHEEKIISGKITTQIKNSTNFNTLIGIYSFLYNSYKSQGNKKNANACYVEWKNIETEYFEFILSKKYDQNVYFLWIMNLFLETFCDYGTNPFKSLNWSFFVMFCFGLFYFIFPNSNNLSNELSYYNKIKNLMGYFTENKRFTECLIDTSIYNARIKKPDIVYKEIKRNSSILPIYFRIFASPPGKIIRIFHYFKLKLLRKADQFAGRWNEISKTKKKIIYVFYGMMMFLALSYLILIKFINAMILSLNAFSALGFGEIPVQGIAKYLTIIEGFVGWFLLSIFSVALLSQIIQ